MRLGEIKRLLDDTDLTLPRIADGTGLGNVHYFSNCFRDVRTDAGELSQADSLSGRLRSLSEAVDELFGIFGSSHGVSRPQTHVRYRLRRDMISHPYYAIA